MKRLAATERGSRSPTTGNAVESFWDFDDSQEGKRKLAQALLEDVEKVSDSSPPA